MPASRIHEGTDRPSRIASWAPIAISSRSPAGEAGLKARSASPPLPSSTAGPMKKNHRSTAAAGEPGGAKKEAPGAPRRGGGDDQATGGGAGVADRALKPPQHREPDGDQHIPTDVEDIAEVRIDREVEDVFVHAPRHVTGDE